MIIGINTLSLSLSKSWNSLGARNMRRSSHGRHPRAERGDTLEKKPTMHVIVVSTNSIQGFVQHSFKATELHISLLLILPAFVTDKRSL